MGCLIALSAGIFEEVFRFLFRRFLVREGVKISEPIIFGLGHSLMEIIYIFAPVIFDVRVFGIKFITRLDPIYYYLSVIEYGKFYEFIVFVLTLFIIDKIISFIKAK